MIPAALKALLLAGINPKRVGQANNRAHVEAYEIRAHLIRTFDFDGWDERILTNDLVFESEKDGRWTACYRAQCELTVRWPDGNASVYTEWATGDSQNQPSRSDAHDMALKTAQSQALKRCAMNLGDQFGLSLYRRGQLSPIVGRTWDMATAPSSNEVPKVDAHVSESVPESEQVEAAPDTHTQSEPPKEISDQDAKALRVADLTAQLHTWPNRATVAGIAKDVMKEKLAGALTDDGQGNVLTLGALCDAALKKAARAS